jgi:hypothetical protein
METASDAVVVDHLEAHPYLASNRGHINPFGRQLMNLRVSCEALLMESESDLIAFGLPLYADFSLHASIFHGGK